ncbi:MAG: hypothetical protein N3E44_05300, partial [Candidatus Bathyarchaeota archaeon]|nr:hypothetical protein [Candidatus Bathyarchaeota archaeon]
WMPCLRERYGGVLLCSEYILFGSRVASRSNTSSVFVSSMVDRFNLGWIFGKFVDISRSEVACNPIKSYITL